MRTTVWWAAVLGAAWLAVPAHAQTTFTFGGADPTHIVNQPVTVPGVAEQPIAGPMQLSSIFHSLTSILPQVSFPSATPTIGHSTFPTPSNMPGKDYLKHFGFSKPRPVPD
jgi:hypothetical protein